MTTSRPSWTPANSLGHSYHSTLQQSPQGLPGHQLTFWVSSHSTLLQTHSMTASRLLENACLVTLCVNVNGKCLSCDLKCECGWECLSCDLEVWMLIKNACLMTLKCECWWKMPVLWPWSVNIECACSRLPKKDSRITAMVLHELRTLWVGTGGGQVAMIDVITWTPLTITHRHTASVRCLLSVKLTGMWCCHSLYWQVCGVVIHSTDRYVVVSYMVLTGMWCCHTLYWYVCGGVIHCTGKYVAVLYIVLTGMWWCCTLYFQVCGGVVHCTYRYVVVLYIVLTGMWCCCTL